MSVAVTGIGVHCSLGDNIEALWASMMNGKCGIDTIQRFDISPFTTKLGAMVPPENDNLSDQQRILTYAHNAATETLDMANIKDLDQVSLVIGTSNGLMGEKIYNVSYDLAFCLSIGGINTTFSTACASSAHAIGFAYNLIFRGHSKYVLVGGVDLLTRDIFAGFHSLGLLARNPCAPFSLNFGTTLGEGAAFLFLERASSAKQRKAPSLASFIGYGFSADGYHDTKPDSGGFGISKAIDFALKNAGLEPYLIDYVNAHGTGTLANDSAEWQGISRSLCKNSQELPVSSSKSFVGHTQGAAGALEVVITLISMKHGRIPHTLNYINPRPNTPKDPVAATSPRRRKINYAMCLNSGFAGVNTALLIGSKNTRNNEVKKIHRSISIKAYSINNDCNTIKQFIPESELRGLDQTALLLSGAVAKTLVDGGFHLRSVKCEDIGLFVGQDQVSPDSVDELYESINKRGIRRLSAAAFTRLVVNYPTGVCCRLFGLKGPSATMAAKPDSGLIAFLYGLDFLSFRNDSDYLLAASVSIPTDKTSSQPVATAILLEAEATDNKLEISGWALHKDPKQSLERAFSMAKWGRKDAIWDEISFLAENDGIKTLIEKIEVMQGKGFRHLLINTTHLNSVGLALTQNNNY